MLNILGRKLFFIVIFLLVNLPCKAQDSSERPTANHVREIHIPKMFLTCAPTSTHFMVESFGVYGLMRPLFASVDFGRIHAV